VIEAAARDDAARTPAPPISLVGPVADPLLLGCGATLIAYACWWLLVRVVPGAEAWPWALALSMLVVSPHYAATYRRAYASLERVRAHLLATVIAPLVLVAGAVASLVFPRHVAPLFMLGYVAWSGYHYAGQSLGIALLYPLRQGQPLAPAEKRTLALPLYASWLMSLAAVLDPWRPARNASFWYVRDAFPWLRLGRGVTVGALALLALSCLGVARLARDRRRAGTPLPSAVFGVLLTQMLWFTLGLVDLFFAAILVPALHSLQYLALTTWHHGRAQSPQRRGRALAAYAAFLLLFGAMLNEGLYRAVGRLGLDANLTAGTVFAFVNLHHYVLDGRIWRLRDRRVRASFA
jgi:hypothetical protein